MTTKTAPAPTIGRIANDLARKAATVTTATNAVTQLLTPPPANGAQWKAAARATMRLSAVVNTAVLASMSAAAHLTPTVVIAAAPAQVDRLNVALSSIRRALTCAGLTMTATLLVEWPGDRAQ